MTNNMLFNGMIIHGLSPSDMCVGTMVPIPKGKRINLSRSENVRGICLQSKLCNILDIFMLKREKDTLNTSELQFGFKEKDVIQIMQSHLKITSFRNWRRRVRGRATKHLSLRSPDVLRGYCKTQYKIRKAKKK